MNAMQLVAKMAEILETSSRENVDDCGFTSESNEAIEQLKRRGFVRIGRIGPFGLIRPTESGMSWLREKRTFA